MQPVRDRNTGIWDDVAVLYTGPAAPQDLHIVTGQVGADVPLQDRAAIQARPSCTANLVKASVSSDLADTLPQAHSLYGWSALAHCSLQLQADKYLSDLLSPSRGCLTL